jgi:hypothetical protein
MPTRRHYRFKTALQQQTENLEAASKSRKFTQSSHQTQDNTVSVVKTHGFALQFV